VKFVIGDTMPGATEQTYSSDGRTLLIYVQSIPARWQSPPSGTHVVTVQGRKATCFKGKTQPKLFWLATVQSASNTLSREDEGTPAAIF